MDWVLAYVGINKVFLAGFNSYISGAAWKGFICLGSLLFGIIFDLYLWSFPNGMSHRRMSHMITFKITPSFSNEYPRLNWMLGFDFSPNLWQVSS